MLGKSIDDLVRHFATTDPIGADAYYTCLDKAYSWLDHLEQLPCGSEIITEGDARNKTVKSQDSMPEGSQLIHDMLTGVRSMLCEQPHRRPKSERVPEIFAPLSTR